ncbi:taste receptor type 2 member 1-like [Pseudophryne corroboree]|uniref:taste receptor type 2 member 1-like n=1 Tax=Pseudophryne corroboree TaxID=495146 RepID=UPI003081CAAD
MGLDHIFVPTYVVGFFIVLIVEIIIGTLTNGFIVFVNFHDWLRGKPLNTSDQLVVSLALSNTCASCANAAIIVCAVYYTDIFLVYYVFCTLYSIMSYCIFSSSWLSAWLCLFFCLKIISFKSGCFAWMKTKVATIVPWLILLSQVLSFCLSIPFFFSFTQVFEPNSTAETGTNYTSGVVVGYEMNSLYNFISMFVNCFIPFLIVMITTGRIIASLHNHARHMRQNMEDDRGPSVKAHQGAARTMMSLLFLYLIFYVVELGIGFLTMLNPIFWICFVLIFSFPTVQSFIVIMGNVKLKQMCLKLLKNSGNKQ